MLVKISTILYLMAAIVYYTNGQIASFWLSVVLGIVTFCLSTYISYRHISPQLRKYREALWQMKSDGASDDEILEFMDQETYVDEDELLQAPLWMHIVVTLGIVASFVLFGIGVIGRILI